MTLYVRSPNFDVLSVIITFLLTKIHRENILKITIKTISSEYNAKGIILVQVRLRTEVLCTTSSDHNSRPTFHVTGTPAVTTRPSVTKEYPLSIVQKE